MVHSNCYVIITVYLHKTPSIPTPGNAFYVRVTADHGSDQFAPRKSKSESENYYCFFFDIYHISISAQCEWVLKVSSKINWLRSTRFMRDGLLHTERQVVRNRLRLPTTIIKLWWPKHLYIVFVYVSLRQKQTWKTRRTHFRNGCQPRESYDVKILRLRTKSTDVIKLSAISGCSYVSCSNQSI